MVDKLRMIKSPDEIARIRRSVLTNSEAFEKTTRSIRPGDPESAIAAELEYQMRRLGAEKAAFETIVAIGIAIRACRMHSPRRGSSANDELLLIDMGACQDGYMSDMTRVLFLGRPSRRVRTMYNAVLKAQLAAIDAVRPGVDSRPTWIARRAACWNPKGLEKSSCIPPVMAWASKFTKRPRLGRRDKTKLEAGMAITIEPGAYIRDFGGIRIEDTVLVTKNGCEVLTPTSKELRLL